MNNKLGTVIGLIVAVLIAVWLYNNGFNKSPTERNSIDLSENSHAEQTESTTSQISLSENEVMNTEASDIDANGQQNNQTTVDNDSVYSTGLPADKNDPVKLAERREVYELINEVVNGLGTGQEPKLDDIQHIGSELVRLTEDGYIPIEDARETFNYLEQSIPSLGKEINFYARQIQ